MSNWINILFFVVTSIASSTVYGQCSADVGTYKTYFNGNRVTNFPIYIYPDETFRIRSDNNFTLPPNFPGEVAELFIMVFDCPPTFNNLPTMDPCWSTLWWTGKDFDDTNNNSSIVTNNFGFGRRFFNTVTVDDGDNNSNPNDVTGFDNNNDNCYDYDLSQAIETYWLKDITAIWLNGCNDGTVRIVPSGGLPEYDAAGSNYVITNRGKGTLADLPVSHNEAFHLTGLQHGDMYNVYITDINGKVDATVSGIYSEISAGNDASVISCSMDSPFSLTSKLGGSPSLGGTWRNPGGSVVTDTYIPGSGGGIYTYSYTHPQNPICIETAEVNISEFVGTSTEIDITLDYCSIDPTVNLFDELTGSPGTSGEWLTPTGATFNGMLDPATAVSGTYVYTENTTNPCDGDIFYVGVTIYQENDAGTNTVHQVCDNESFPISAISLLGGAPDATGTWTDPDNISFNGLFTVSSKSGTYNYVVDNPGCPSDASTVNFTLNTYSDDDYSSTLSFCETDAITDIYNDLTGSPTGGGLWTDPLTNTFNGLLNPATNVSGTYTYDNQSTNPCNFDTYSIEVTISTQPDAGFDATVTLCSGDLPIDATTLLGGTPDAGGQWRRPNGTTFNGNLQPNFTTGDYTYTVTNAPCPNDVATLSATIFTTSDDDYTTRITYCDIDPSVDLFNELKGSPNGGYLWTDPIGSSFNGIFDPGSDPIGTYQYNSQDPSNPCNFDEYFVEVAVNSPPFAGNDASLEVCNNDPAFNLFPNIPNNPDAGGTWTTPDGTNFQGTVFPNLFSAGDYNYTVKVPACPADVATIDLVIHQAPEVYLDPEINIDPGTAYRLPTLASNYTYVAWDPATYLDNPNSLNPVFNPDPKFESGIYGLYLENNYCSTTTSTTINILWPIKAPTGFTPNSDGINDVWEIDYIKLYPDANVTVFNRYGSIVYSGKGADDYWDGRINGTPLPAGSYYFVIEVEEPKTQKLSGIVTIVK